MRKKHKIIDLMEMVRKSPNFAVNEDASGDAEVSTFSPIDIHPSFNGKYGKYYINVSFVVEKEDFNNHKGFTEFMIDKMNRGRLKANKPQLGSDAVKKIEAMYPTHYNLIKGANGESDKCEITVSVNIDDPITLLNDDNTANQESKDFKKLNQLMLWVKKHLNIPDDMVISEATRGIRMLHYSVTNKLTDEIKKNLNDSAERMFINIVKEVGVNDALSTFSSMKIYKDNIVLDHQYSPGNVLSVMQQALDYDNKNGTNQFNTIKYLATQRQWAQLGREVVNTDFPYYMVGSNTGYVSDADRKQYMSQMGQSTLSDLKEDDSRQEKRASSIKASGALNGNKYFNRRAYFDISATELINGVRDSYEDDYGFHNNLTGEWNNASKRRYMELHPQNTQQQTDDATQNTNNEPQLEVDADLIYNAVKQSIGGHNTLSADASIQEKMQFVMKAIQDALKEKFPSYARVLSDKNYGPLIIPSTAIVMRMIGVPEEYRPMVGRTMNDNEAKAMYHPVVQVANVIVDAERKLNKVDKGNIDEMLSLYSSLIISEEVFNNEIKRINENVEKENLI